MSINQPHSTHSEEARADDAAPTDALTDEVREDAAEAESASDSAPTEPEFPDAPALTHP